MTDPLTDQYPEAASYICQAVEEHGEDWVIEHYHPEIAQLGVIMAIPDIEELPFYDPDIHDVMTDDEQRAYYDGLAAHKDNLRTGTNLESN